MRVEREQSRNSGRAGFTLAEILLAMMVFAIAITTILALLARSIETVDEIVLKDEAMRLSSAVEREMTTSLTFNEVYDAINGAPFIEMHAFHYRALNDGARTAQPDRSEEDVLIVPFAGPRNATVPTQEFAAREGRYYRVRLTLSPTNPETLTATADTYPSAALVLFAEFIPLGGPTLELPADPRVVYSYNFAVRR
jgi:prepilin-type N-terminal cleavage/methylation domain-containing protein